MVADDNGRSQLFGESLPGTGGDFIDTNDVEGHMNNEIDSKHENDNAPGLTDSDTDTEGHNRGGPGGHIPGATEGEPEGFNNKHLYPGATEGTDTEGHNRGGPGGHIPGAAEGEPEGFNNKHLYPGASDDSDVAGHNRGGPGGHIPGATEGQPEGFNNKHLYPGIDSDENDVEGHSGPEGFNNKHLYPGFDKRAPGENPHGER
jgi:hypothetical protein